MQTEVLRVLRAEARRGGDIESLEELVTLMRRIGWNAKRSYVTLATFGLRSTTPTLMSAAVGEGPFFTSG